MAVVSIKNKLRRGNLLVGNDPYIPTDFESIATVSVGSGGAANVEFTSIPATFTHLQIRGIMRDARAGTVNDGWLRFNGDTGSNYAAHKLNGDGASATATGAATKTNTEDLFRFPTDNNTASVFGASIIDIFDYANTNKYKTVRALSGYDANGSGVIRFSSGLWQSTSAITSIIIDSDGSVNWSQYSHFALYGIKVAS
jgi:hypothetical protein